MAGVDYMYIVLTVPANIRKPSRKNSNFLVKFLMVGTPNFSWHAHLLLPDPGEARGCSINSFVID